MTRLLLVGCGRIARAAHIPALAALQAEGQVEVVLSDLDPRRARDTASEFGLAATGERWGDVIEEFEALSVCLPPGPNVEVAAAGAALGLHVLCEKPPGRDVAEAEALAGSVTGDPSQVTMIAFNRRFNPLYRRAMEASVALAPPTSFFGRVSLALNVAGSTPSDTAADWITSDSSHALDLAVATIGYPGTVTVDRRRVGAGPENVWTVHLRGEAGSALLLLNYAAGRRSEHYEWTGPGYDVAIDLPKRAEWARGDVVETWAAEGGFHQAGGFVDEYRAFLTAIAGTGVGPRPTCDFAYAADFMRLVGAVLRAAPGESVALAPPAAVVPVPAELVAAKSPAPAVTPGPTRPVVLIQQPAALHARLFSGTALAALGTLCDLRSWAGPDDPGALKEASVVITGRGAKPLKPELLEHAEELRLIVVLGASVRHLGPEKLADRGVLVANTADAVAASVAEHCLMVTLAGLRRLTEIDRAMHAGAWPRPGVPGRASLSALVRRLPIPRPVRLPLGRLERRLRAGQGGAAASPGTASTGPIGAADGHADLAGAVVGLVGWGHTARRFAELLRPFGCDILVCSDAADDNDLAASDARRCTLGELLATARVVSLHKGLTDATRGYLDAHRLAHLQPGTVLVNTARGELIDEAALLARLAAGDIVAALDVFAEEPLPPKHPLRGLPNVILTPHNASTTSGEERRMGDQALTTVVAWLEGRPVEGIPAAQLARMT